MNISNEFWKLCEATQKKWEVTYGDNEIESLLVEILIFVEKNAPYHEALVNCFIELIRDYRRGPLEIVEFCMRKLQWPEVREAALKMQLENEDFRVKTTMAHILEVYEPVWEGEDVYEYYSHNADSKVTQKN